MWHYGWLTFNDYIFVVALKQVLNFFEIDVDRENFTLRIAAVFGSRDHQEIIKFKIAVIVVFLKITQFLLRL